MKKRIRNRAPAPRAVIVHSLDHARLALAAAREANCAVALRSAPGAAATVGAGWFRAMIEIARDEFPDVEFTAALDCGADAGLAFAALREGVALIRLAAPKRVRDKVADIARKSGAALDADRRPALDLLDLTNPQAALRDFLARTTD